jgi:hypothetical protein
MLDMGRGDFGLHFDAGVEGSAGCVVIKNEPAWATLESRLSTFLSAGIEEIPLLIFYS